VLDLEVDAGMVGINLPFLGLGLEGADQIHASQKGEDQESKMPFHRSSPCILAGSRFTFIKIHSLR
jgi:hypothetical protein